MGSMFSGQGSGFGNLMHLFTNPGNFVSTSLIEPGRWRQTQAPSGQTQGPYTGVTPTLAGANAGYQAGGPGAIGGIPNAAGTTPMANPFVAAARSQIPQTPTPMRGW